MNIMKQPLIYLSGAISTLPIEKAKAIFDIYQNRLEAQGFAVMNPFKIAPYKEGKTWGEYMEDCIEAIDTQQPDLIAMIPNWKQSKGARIERAYCIAEKNMQVLYMHEMGYNEADIDQQPLMVTEAPEPTRSKPTEYPDDPALYNTCLDDNDDSYCIGCIFQSVSCFQTNPKLNDYCHANNVVYTGLKQ